MWRFVTDSTLTKTLKCELYFYDLEVEHDHVIWMKKTKVFGLMFRNMAHNNIPYEISNNGGHNSTWWDRLNNEQKSNLINFGDENPIDIEFRRGRKSTILFGQCCCRIDTVSINVHEKGVNYPQPMTKEKKTKIIISIVNTLEYSVRLSLRQVIYTWVTQALRLKIADIIKFELNPLAQISILKMNITSPTLNTIQSITLKHMIPLFFSYVFVFIYRVICGRNEVNVHFSRSIPFKNFFFIRHESIGNQQDSFNEKRAVLTFSIPRTLFAPVHSINRSFPF